jgi:hypothetical protein
MQEARERETLRPTPRSLVSLVFDHAVLLWSLRFLPGSLAQVSQTSKSDRGCNSTNDLLKSPTVFKCAARGKADWLNGCLSVL